VNVACLTLDIELAVLMLEGFWIYDERLVPVETLSARPNYLISEACDGHYAFVRIDRSASFMSWAVAKRSLR